MTTSTGAPGPGSAPERGPGTGPAGSMTLSVARSRWRSVLVLLVVLGALGTTAAWYLTHPAPLPLRDGHVTAVTSPGRPVYVGAFTPGPTFGRTLTLGGVRVRTESTVPVEVEPLLCRGGSVSVTSDAEVFCADLVDPAGATLGPRDSVVLRVTADEPGAAFISRVTLAYREGLRVGAQPAGTAAVIAVVPSPGG